MFENTKNNPKRIILSIIIIAVLLIGALVAIYSKMVGFNNLPFSNTKEQTSSPAAFEPAVQPIQEFNSLDYSKAEITVEGLVDSSDVYKVKRALQDIEGVARSLIDSASGAVNIYFDQTKIKNPDKIAKKIKKTTGYTAQVNRIVNKEDMTQTDDYNQKITDMYVATVHDFDITKADLDREVAMYKAKYIERYGEDIFNSPTSTQLLDNIMVQSLMGLIDEAIIKVDIAKAEYELKPEDIEAGLTKLLEDNAITLEEAIERSGYENEDYFVNKLKNQVLIKNYIENVIFDPNMIDAQKGQRYNEWFTNIKSLSDTVYYDSQLQDAVAKAQACSIQGCGDPNCK